MPVSASKILLPFKYFIEKSGANYHQVAKLVDLKFLLDNRKKLPNNRGKKEPSNSILRQAASFLIVGVFITLMLYRTNDVYLFIFMFQTMLMVMNSITMLAEYSVSLFDSRDNALLLPLPANGQTLGWARVTHILIYLFLLSLGMMLPGIIFSIFKFGVDTALLFFVSVFFNTLFTIFITVFIYLRLIKLLDGEKLKDTMMYLQVGLTIIVVVAYQIIPRYIMPENGEAFELTPNWYFLFFPPAWFTSLSSLTKQPSLINAVGGGIAVLIPIASIMFISKKLFYGFNEGLIKMASQSGAKNVKVKSEQKEGVWLKISSKLMGAGENEYPTFKLIWRLTGRERLFKQSVLPILAYAVVVPAVSIFAAGGIDHIQKNYLPFLYFTVMSSSMLPTILTIGDNKHAEWIFYSLPNAEAHRIFKAAFKVCISKFFLPSYLIIALPLFYFKGALAAIDIVSVFLFNYMVALLIQYLQTPHFMFTQEKSASQGGKTALKMFLVMFIAFPLGFLHSFLNKKNIWLPMILPVAYTVIIFILNKYSIPKRYTWKYVKAVNQQF